MKIADIFESFAADFESTLHDDDWSRLEKYFTNDARYLNIGDPDSHCNGRGAILSYLKTDVTHSIDVIYWLSLFRISKI